jgi:rare lipoprotein A
MNRRFLACVGLVALLAGCGDNHPSRGGVDGEGASTAAVANGRGVYKVGDPYQINGVWFSPSEDYSYDETGIASWYGPGFHEKYTANGEIYDMNEVTAAHRTLPMPCFVRVTNLDNGRSIIVRINDRGPYARGRIIDMSRRGAQLLGFEQNGTAKVRVQILADESKEIASALRAQGAVSAGSRVAKGPITPPPGGDTYVPRPVATLRPGEAAPVAAPREGVAATSLAPPTPPPPPSGPGPGSAASGTTVSASADGAFLPAGMRDPTLAAPVVTPVKHAPQIFVQAGAFANADNARRLSTTLSKIGAAAVIPVVIGTQHLFRVRIGPLASVEDGDKMLDQVINAGHPEARLVVD